MDFDDLDALCREIEKDANKVLRTEVAIISRKEMQRQIQDKVYDVYSPIVYERRGYNDGLIDANNIELGVQDDNTIYIENIAYDGIRNVPEIIESGEGYWLGAPDTLTRGRKFTQATVESLENSDTLAQSMKNGLNRLGLDCTIVSNR